MITDEIKKERRRVGDMIAERRRMLRMDQERLAELTGMTQPHISRIENGKYSLGLDTLAKIADALMCSIEFVPR